MSAIYTVLYYTFDHIIIIMYECHLYYTILYLRPHHHHHHHHVGVLDSAHTTHKSTEREKDGLEKQLADALLASHEAMNALQSVLVVMGVSTASLLRESACNHSSANSIISIIITTLIIIYRRCYSSSSSLSSPSYSIFYHHYKSSSLSPSYL